MYSMVIAVDFDNTVHRPSTGEDVPLAVQSLKQLVRRGHKIILWTARSGIGLANAIQWYKERRIPLFGINRHPEQDPNIHSPKAFANAYVDDLALGVPLVFPDASTGSRDPYVDWPEVMRLIRERRG